MLHTEFASLLRRSGTSQAQFVKLTGATPQGVNNWNRGRRRAPEWAIALAVALIRTPSWELEALRKSIMFEWRETLGVTHACFATQTDVKKARALLARKYHPDVGGMTTDMQRINAAYDAGIRATSK